MLHRFRVLFGLLMAVGAARYWLNGWIEEQLTATVVRFPWPGLEWITPVPGHGTHALFAVMIVAGLAMAVDRWTRPAAAVFALCFTWVEFIDRTNYLNHYYLVSLVAVLLAVLPRGATVTFGAYRLLQSQFAVVWFFAGLAKLSGDWLLAAMPLGLWLPTHADLPVVGPLLAASATAYAFSWGGAAFDLVLPAALFWPRTRRVAFGVAIVFHLTVWALFPIGIFSPLMILGATLFFAPVPPSTSTDARPRRWAIALAGVWLTVQCVLPLRHLAYPGPVNWTEEGFRFAWRVMLIEKVGRVEFTVTATDPPARYVVRQFDDLTPLQRRMMATQPDLVHAYALHLADRYRETHGSVQVRADAVVSFNGRPAARFIDPGFDLAATPEPQGPAPYVLPSP